MSPNDVVRQDLRPGCVVETLRDGTVRAVPYLVDENGEQYVEAWHAWQSAPQEGA
jgi:hypothetical protein